MVNISFNDVFINVFISYIDVIKRVNISCIDVFIIIIISILMYLQLYANHDSSSM